MDQSQILTHHRVLCAWLLAAALAGCAIPQPALDQANNAGNLMQQLQHDVDVFQQQQAQLAQERIASIKAQRRLLLQYASSQSDEDTLNAAVGLNSDDEALFNKLKTLSDQQAKSRDDLTVALADLDTQLDKLLSTAPSASKAIGDAQHAISPLGLKRDERTFVLAYVKSVKSSGAALAAAAAASAASAPQPAAPASAP